MTLSHGLAVAILFIILCQYTEGEGRVFMGVCSFCGDETTNVSRPMAGHMRHWAHRNAQRDHTPRETLPSPSSPRHH
jgi:hypothetical protein